MAHSSPGLILKEMLWQNVRRAVHNWMPTNLKEMKQYSELKFLHKQVRDWLSHAEINYFKLLLLKVAVQDTDSWRVLSSLWLCITIIWIFKQLYEVVKKSNLEVEIFK